MPDREKVRADFDKFLREIITEREIDLIAEEAGDDKEAWERLKRDDEIAAQFGGLFGDDTTVDNPVPTIARTIADEYRVQHSDVDVDVRANENDFESIKKRGDAMIEEILKALGSVENVLVIVGEKHRADVVQVLKDRGLSVQSASFLK